ncbi:MAG: TolC family protein [Rikenellaceae bacterium]
MNKIKKRLAMVIALLSAVGISTAQSGAKFSMTIDDCLNYAKENSIVLKQYALDIDDRIADELSAKGAFLPNLSGYVGENLSSNPAAQIGSNGVSFSGNYALDLSLDIYSGGANRATLQQSKLNKQIATLSLAEQENSIEVAVTEVFVQILYAMEQIEVSKQSLMVSEKALERGAAMYEVGSINKADYSLLESARATDLYDIVVAETTLSNLYVSLKQLLEISADVEISVIAPNINEISMMSVVPQVAEVYDIALKTRPEITSSVLSIETAKYDEKIARSGYLPSLTLSAGVGNGHLNNTYALNTQMRENFSTNVGVGLSVPIFNNYKTKTSVQKARNSVTSAELTLTDRQKYLYQTIEQLHNNTKTAMALYTVSDYKLKAVETSLELTFQQYEVGMKNIVELLIDQDSRRDAAQEFLINKYQLLYNRAILEFYRTDIIKL